MPRDRLPYLILPVAAAIAILPLLLHGPSCGHDFDFHLLNWFEAAAQFRHGNLHPQWAVSPAWNAGEPRFVFYPPLSWTLGAILGLLFPWTWTPIVYTWLALTASGLAMHRLARAHANPAAALLASTLYLANPYMLFTAYERTAYAELLAAAFLPLLIHAILKPRPTIAAIAIPLALLWLTNAPAAVMGTYTLALLALIRLLMQISPKWSSFRNTGGPAFRPVLPSDPRVPHPSRPHREGWGYELHSLPLAITTAGGTLLGLSLAAFYILPAATGRPLVQIAMVILPGMRIDDNTLFHHTGVTEDALAHDAVLHTASLIALALLILTAALLLAGTRFSKTPTTLPPQEKDHPAPSTDQTSAPATDRASIPEAYRASAFAPEVAQGFSLGSQEPLPGDGALAPGVCSRTRRHDLPPSYLLFPLAILTAAIAILLTPISLPLWHQAPELAFLQFPWRLLAVLAVVFALSAALALNRLQLKPLPVALAALTLAAALTAAAYPNFHQPCDPEDTVQARLTVFQAQQGSEPTDEYTPAPADNDSLHQRNPPFWLSTDPDAPPPPEAAPGPAPQDFTIAPPAPEYLILNLRRFPAWRVTLNGHPVPAAVLTQNPRADGLLTLPVPPGPDRLQLTYQPTPLEHSADALSTLALLTLALILRRPANLNPR